MFITTIIWQIFNLCLQILLFVCLCLYIRKRVKEKKTQSDKTIYIGKDKAEVTRILSLLEKNGILYKMEKLNIDNNTYMDVYNGNFEVFHISVVESVYIKALQILL